MRMKDREQPRNVATLKGGVVAMGSAGILVAGGWYRPSSGRSRTAALRSLSTLTELSPVHFELPADQERVRT